MLDLEFVRKVAQKVYAGAFDEAHTMIALACQTSTSGSHRSQCHRVLAECLMEQGEFGLAEAELHVALDHATGHLVEQSFVCGDLLSLAHLTGNLELGEQTERAWIALERFAQDEPEIAAMRGRAFLSRGYLSLLRGELHAAAGWFWAAVQYYNRPNSHPREGADRTTLLPASYCLHAHVMLRQNRLSTVAQDLTLASDWIAEGSYLWNYYIALQAEYSLAQDRLPEAVEWTKRETAGGVHDGHPRLAIARARVAHAQGALSEAAVHALQAEKALRPGYRGYLFTEVTELRQTLFG